MDVTEVWDDLLTPTDRAVIENAGFGKRRGFGTNPMLVMIDCQYNYIGADKPITEQQAEYPAGGGEGAWKAIRTIEGLLAIAREIDIPVLYTRNVQKRTIRFDSFAGKSTWDHAKTLDDAPGSRIVEEISPRPEDFVIDKSYASAFYGTPLVNYLVGLKIDTLIMTGVSTSGCVRATAVDGVTRGFNVAVVADGTADRIEASHKIALLDLWMKYADVVGSDEVSSYLEGFKG